MSNAQTNGTRRSKKMALCLAGGGITGAMYQVGCLAALEDAFESFRSSEFDLYVATSSGSTLAVGLAGGLSAERMYRALLDPADDFFPLQRHHLLRFDMREWKRAGGSAFGATRRFLNFVTSHPLEVDLWQEMEGFVDSLPAGIFSMDAYERFLESFMTRRGIPKSFDQFEGRLVIVATDLDAGTRAIFGEGDLAGVSVARAVSAASAIPVLFAPVRAGGRDFIDGGIGEVAHVDLAEERGASLVIILNPMVPVAPDLAMREVPTQHARMKRVRDKGLLWVYNQALRVRSETRFLAGLARYRAEHPDSTFLLVEPDSSDAIMFMYSPMNFAARRAILEHGYETTRLLLTNPEAPLRRALESRGLRLKSAPEGHPAS